MEFLGIGPMELVFILVIALVIFGPQDIVRAARSFGRLLNQLYRSDTYKLMKRATEELRQLPDRLAETAGLEELEAIQKATASELEQIKVAADPTRNPPAAPAAPVAAERIAASGPPPTDPSHPA